MNYGWLTVNYVRAAMGNNNEGFDIMHYMNAVTVSPVGTLRNMCQQNEKRYLRNSTYISAPRAEHFVKSWAFFACSALRRNFPDRCSICEEGNWQWRNRLEEVFYAFRRTSKAITTSFFGTATRRRRVCWGSQVPSHDLSKGFVSCSLHWDLHLWRKKQLHQEGFGGLMHRKNAWG